MLRPILDLLDPQDRLGSLWCSLAHDAAMWPIHGQYACRTCSRHHRVPWAAEAKASRRVSSPLAELHPKTLAGHAGD